MSPWALSSKEADQGWLLCQHDNGGLRQSTSESIIVYHNKVAIVFTDSNLLRLQDSVMMLPKWAGSKQNQMQVQADEAIQVAPLNHVTSWLVLCC